MKKLELYRPRFFKGNTKRWLMRNYQLEHFHKLLSNLSISCKIK
jgi:hypothetical protein